MEVVQGRTGKNVREEAAKSAWVNPRVSRLDAGAAEFQVGPTDDGVDLS